MKAVRLQLVVNLIVGLPLGPDLMVAHKDHVAVLYRACLAVWTKYGSAWIWNTLTKTTWFGEVEVKVGVSGVEEILKTLDLCIGDCPQRNKGVIIADTVAVEIDGKDYAVILKDVVPFPSTTNQDKSKEAILEIISK